MTPARRLTNNHRTTTAPLIGHRRPPLTAQGLIERERMALLRERHQRIFRGLA